MTESNAALAEAPADLPSNDDDQGQAGGDRRRLLIIGGAVLGVIVLGLAAWFLLFSGGSANDQSGTVPPAPAKPSASAAPQPKAAAPAAGAGAAAAAKFSGNLGRDPFTPLYPAAAAPAAGGSQAAAGASSGSSTSSGTTAASSGGTPVSIEMVSVDASSATLTVDGKKYTPKVGDVFATNFKLYGLFDSRCAGILYGDKSIPLCEGDVTTVTP